MIRAVFLLLAAAGLARAELLLDFPTPNHSLLKGPSGDFFMYVDRDFEGERSKPWQGGEFGYVRGPRRYNGSVVYTAIHEGIDIKPMHRDAAGNPMDTVTAAGDGVVAYVNTKPGASNYGRYVVIEHRIDGSPYYSLYAHLASASVAAGNRVRQGDPIGVMGYSGSGIDRTRAHTHFEFTMMLNPNFDAWDAHVHPGDPNVHGNFNGRNLVGVDPAALLLAVRKSPETFDLRAYLRKQDPYFRVAIPAPADFPLLRLYPWLLEGTPPPHPVGWSISFSRYGTPISVAPYLRPISKPIVEWTRPTNLPDSSATRGLVTHSGGVPVLSSSGREMIDLLTAPATR